MIWALLFLDDRAMTNPPFFLKIAFKIQSSALASALKGVPKWQLQCYDYEKKKTDMPICAFHTPRMLSEQSHPGHPPSIQRPCRHSLGWS